MTQLQDLYDYLQANYEPLTEGDLSISGPNDDEPTDYICCDQKIVIFKNNGFQIADLYDSHPTLFFENKEQVLSFYEGWSRPTFYVDFIDENKSAESIGILIAMSETMTRNMDNPYWKKVISPTQVQYTKK